MTKRTGIPSVIEAAKALCVLLTNFRSIIEKYTNYDPVVKDALDAAQIACALLQTSLEPYREYGD